MAKETSGFRRAGISPALWLLAPAFSLPYAPAWVSPSPSQQNGTLSYHAARISLRSMTSSIRYYVFGIKYDAYERRVAYLLLDTCYLILRIECNEMRTTSAVSVPYLSPDHLRRRISGSVSCYAIFKGWLLLSQPPDC